ncbi:TonB-dependent receptor [Ferruginibacter sp.]|nr:TonB-dependent receptor [Ferruginibacter sp.]
MKIHLLLIAQFFTLVSFSQQKSKSELENSRVTLSGTIKDFKTSETIFGANIFIKELKLGIISNEYGFYSVTIPAGKYTITVSYSGFKTEEDSILLNYNFKRDFSLSENSRELQTVVVSTSKKQSEIKNTEMSVNKLSVQIIKQMPVVFGEVDILKSILQLPGVTNSGEGQSGFNVRGGSADQNLILLDEATVYNSSHLFGFFSVFNADAIKDLKLYKGGIPARFGGRLSSVLDIYQKDGNKEQFKVTGGIGLISSRLMAEGPLKKDKGSFLVAGRGSYGHLFLKLADNKNSAYFYDLNTKFNYTLNNKNKFFLSGYFGRDVFDLNGGFVNTFGNSFGNLRWNHLFSDKLFSNLSLIYSDYYYGLKISYLGFDWNSGIKNFNLKYDFKHYLSNATKLTYGLNAQYYNFNPGKIEPIDENSGIKTTQLDKKFAFEPALYFDVDQKLLKKLTINYGLRFSMFYRLGKQDVNVYANNLPVIFNNNFKIYEKAIPISVKKYKTNETIAKFNNLEPRLAISYAFNDNQSIKASYNRMTQYLHLISNTSSPTPLDIWSPSDNFFKPQLLDQYAIGYFRNFKTGKYSLELESFYKKTKNRIDYIDGAELITNNALEQVVLNGKGRAYGLELLVRKNTGVLSGWIAYTLSKTEQQTPGRTPQETGINDGQWYRSNYDKLHNVSATLIYKRNNKWTFGSIFTLQSGQPATFPNGQYTYQGITIPSYGARNENSLPLFHHWDVSATLTPKRSKTKKWKSEWIFSIYNLYNRNNAASINFRQNSENAKNEAVKFSIFGILPGITYNFKF